GSPADSTKTLLQEFRHSFLQGTPVSNGYKPAVRVSCSAGRFQRTPLAHGRGSPIEVSGLASTQVQAPTKDKCAGRNPSGARGYHLVGNRAAERRRDRRLRGSRGLRDTAFRA